MQKISPEKKSEKGKEFENCFNPGSRSISHSRIHREKDKELVSEVRTHATAYERLQCVTPVATRCPEALGGKGSAERQQGSQVELRVRKRMGVYGCVVLRDESASDGERGQKNYLQEKPVICKECGKVQTSSCTRESTLGRNLFYVMNAEKALERGHTSYSISGYTVVRMPGMWEELQPEVKSPSSSGHPHWGEIF